MKPISRYLDEAIDSGVSKNDSETARKIGVTRAAVSDWRVGRRAPDDDQAVKLAELLHKDPGEILAECGAARAKTPETRRAWERIAARMAAGAAMVAVLVVITESEEVYANAMTDTELTVFRTSGLLLLQWLIVRHARYDGVNMHIGLCIQLISKSLFNRLSALLGHRAEVA